MRILIIDNYSDCPIGLVGGALSEAGAVIDRRHPYNGEAMPENASNHDGLIILGGPQNALADDEHPYLKPLYDLSLDFTRPIRPCSAFALAANFWHGRMAGRTLLAARLSLVGKMSPRLRLARLVR